MPVQVLLALDFEVTVTVVIHTTLTGVLVIVKLLVALLVLVTGDVKKTTELSSLFAVTLIVTPCEGMVEVIVTTSGKSVCGAGACVEFSGGFNVTTKLASVGGAGGFVLLPQLPEIINAEITKL